MSSRKILRLKSKVIGNALQSQKQWEFNCLNKEIRALFPAAEKYTYLNSAAVAPLPLLAAKAVAAQLRDVSENGSVNFTDWVQTKNRARALAAQMLGVKAEQIAFVRNTSDGLATIANGLKWKNGDNIVSFAREFPANFYAWRRIRDTFGVELRLCPERNGRIDSDEFINLIDAKTRIVAISAVQYGSGFRSDLEKIGRAARAVDALFVVDIIQAFGALPLDLPAQMVDAAAGASHKWLCAPEGCGILYLSNRARERVQPTLVGWISVGVPWDFENVEQTFQPNALAWETGTGAASLFYGLEQSLKLLNETGAENIGNYLEELSDYLCEFLAGKNYEIVSSRAANEKSQIVCIEYRGSLTSNEIAELLQKENIIVSPRGSRIRVAPHFFNNREDIKRLIEFLP
ncbi:MAG: aminotransferase class V-fold PLP-dependent enzyme [Acidobacteria bacterium]|nr:aminotransferase class V-fold PLP-dependent enzyme [Acidobacteriota bacterium]